MTNSESIVFRQNKSISIQIQLAFRTEKNSDIELFRFLNGSIAQSILMLGFLDQVRCSRRLDLVPED